MEFHSFDLSILRVTNRVKIMQDKQSYIRKSRRISPIQTSKPRILLICCGTETEPNYFNGLRDKFELKSATVIVKSAMKSDPSSIVSEAEKCFYHEKDKGDPYDRVYCIFDKDDFKDYEEAKLRIKNHKKTDVFFATFSVPCFEYWFLIHFGDTSSPYKSTPDKSAADLLIADLIKKWPEYKKNIKDSFEFLEDRLPEAMKAGKKSLKEYAKYGGDCSHTNVHELIKYLEQFKS